MEFPHCVGGVEKRRLFVCFVRDASFGRLTAEAIKGASLSLKCMNHVKGSDCLSACMLSVRDCITDDILKEHFEDASGLLVNETRDTLDTTSAC